MVQPCGEDGRDRIAKRDTVKECLKKRGLDVWQTRRMVQDRSEWWGFVRRHSPGDEPQTLIRCYMKTL